MYPWYCTAMRHQGEGKRQSKRHCSPEGIAEARASLFNRNDFADFFVGHHKNRIFLRHNSVQRVVRQQKPQFRLTISVEGAHNHHQRKSTLASGATFQPKLLTPVPLCYDFRKTKSTRISPEQYNCVNLSSTPQTLPWRLCQAGCGRLCRPACSTA